MIKEIKLNKPTKYEQDFIKKWNSRVQFKKKAQTKTEEHFFVVVVFLKKKNRKSETVAQEDKFPARSSG